jgi:hypothetical protein
VKIYRDGAEVLRDLGITEPGEIDLDAIAFHCGATVHCAPLRGCAAHIIGHGDRAVITVDKASPRTRQRFSIGHELGHWMWHRGRALSCQQRDMDRPWSALDQEAVANGFAADLLMPEFLFGPRVNGKAVSFDTVDALAAEFSVSRSAAAIRVVDLGSYEAMALCSGRAGIEWFHGSKRVQGHFWPHKQLSRDSDAWDILMKGGMGNQRPQTVDADDWIDHVDAAKYEILEHSVRYGEGVLTLLWWRNDRMIEDLVG